MNPIVTGSKFELQTKCNKVASRNPIKSKRNIVKEHCCSSKLSTQKRCQNSKTHCWQKLIPGHFEKLKLMDKFGDRKAIFFRF